MNQFEILCKLASDEHWCWNLSCTTCGHMNFRYAFSEIAAGKSPDKPGWIVHDRNTGYSSSLGSLPRNYSKEEKEKLNDICRNASLSSIAKVCKFPDWLGYLGLVLEHMYSGEESYKKLSKNWASQLSGLISEESLIRVRLSGIAQGNGLLNIKDLEACEADIIHNNRLQRRSIG